MSQLSDIRNAVADRIRASGIDSSVNVFAYPPDNPALPAVLIFPADGEYADYHLTFGAVRVQSARLVARVVVPIGGSFESAQEKLDELLSSGSGESVSLPDAITGVATVGDGTADVLAGNSENWAVGELVRAQTTPVVTCDIPIQVVVNRS